MHVVRDSILLGCKILGAAIAVTFAIGFIAEARYPNPVRFTNSADIVWENLDYLERPPSERAERIN